MIHGASYRFVATVVVIEAEDGGYYLFKSIDNIMRDGDGHRLSVRAQNCLRNHGIKYVGELVQKTESEMLRMKNFGRKSLKEVKDTLAGLRLNLGMKLYLGGRI